MFFYGNNQKPSLPLVYTKYYIEQNKMIIIVKYGNNNIKGDDINEFI